MHEALKDQFSFPGKLIGKDGKTLQKIADMDGTVSKSTVHEALRNHVSDSGNVPATIIDTKGRKQPTTLSPVEQGNR